MFQEVDAALVALIKDEAIGDADVAIALDVPNRPWFAAVQGLTVNVFLYDVRENAARRDVMYEPVLDETGRIVGRRAPAMRYDLYYLLSVWGTTDPALEHQVMAALLVGLGRHDVFPEARVPEQHRELGLWHLSVASGGKRMMPGNFGGEMKLQAEVSVTVPLPPRIPLSVGPPVDRPMDIRMAGAGGQREQVQGRPPAPGDPRAAGAQPGRRLSPVSRSLGRVGRSTRRASGSSSRRPSPAVPPARPGQVGRRAPGPAGCRWSAGRRPAAGCRRSAAGSASGPARSRRSGSAGRPDGGAAQRARPGGPGPGRARPGPGPGRHRDEPPRRTARPGAASAGPAGPAAPPGQAPQGQAPQGQAPQGQAPQGQAPQGQAPSPPRPAERPAPQQPPSSAADHRPSGRKPSSRLPSSRRRRRGPRAGHRGAPRRRRSATARRSELSASAGQGFDLDDLAGAEGAGPLVGDDSARGVGERAAVPEGGGLVAVAPARSGRQVLDRGGSARVGDGVVEVAA